MACKYYHTITGLTANTTDSTLTATFNSAVTASNGDRFCFRLMADVPAGASAYTVLFTINGVATNAVLNKYGNPITGADLKNCKLYCGYYGSNTPQVIITNYPVKKYGCNCQGEK